MNITDPAIVEMDEESFWQLDLASDAVSFFTIFVAVLGFCGNIWTVFAASKLDSDTSGTCFIKCLAVADMSSAFCDGLGAPLIQLSGLPILTINRWVCKSFNYASWLTTFAG